MKYKNISVLLALLSAVFMGFTSLTPLKDDGSGQIKVEMVTDYGTIKIKLYNETPLHRDNFVKLVDSYSGKFANQEAIAYFAKSLEPYLRKNFAPRAPDVTAAQVAARRK